MNKKQRYSNSEAQGSSILTDVLYCADCADYFRVKYEILFLKGEYKGETKTIFADLDEIECDSLSGFLVDNDYLTEYTNQEDYFKVISREVFIANWERKLYLI